MTTTPSPYMSDLQPFLLSPDLTHSITETLISFVRRTGTYLRSGCYITKGVSMGLLYHFKCVSLSTLGCFRIPTATVSGWSFYYFFPL